MLGRISPSGQFAEVPLPFPSGENGNFLFGPDGNIWYGGNTDIVDMTPQGVLLHDFTIPSAPSNFANIFIALGSDGNIWYTEPDKSDVVGKITLDGQITEYPIPFNANNIISGPDGNIWFGSNDTQALGRITPGGTIDLYDLPPLRLVMPLGGCGSVRTAIFG